MDAQALVNLCEERFGDTGNALHTDDEWLAYLNAAYREFLRATKWPNLVDETTATIPAKGRSVALPAVAQQGGVVSVFVDGMPLEPQPEDLPIRNIRHWTDRPTIPVYWQIRGSRIVVLPAWDAGGTLTIAYLKAPTALTLTPAPNDPVIPETYHDALVSGALARAYRDDGNPELASAYQDEFDRAATGAVRDTPPEG